MPNSPTSSDARRATSWEGTSLVGVPSIGSASSFVEKRRQKWEEADEKSLYQGVVEYAPEKIGTFKYNYGSYGIFRCNFPRLAKVYSIPTPGAISAGWKPFDGSTGVWRQTAEEYQYSLFTHALIATFGLLTTERKMKILASKTFITTAKL